MIKFIISLIYYLINKSDYNCFFPILNNRSLLLASGPSSQNLKNYISNYDTIVVVGLAVELLLPFSEKLKNKQIYIIISPFHEPQTRNDWEEWLIRIKNAADNFKLLKIVTFSGFTTRYMVGMCNNILLLPTLHFYCLPNFHSVKFLNAFRFPSISSFFSSGSVYGLYFLSFTTSGNIDLLGVDHTIVFDIDELENQKLRSTVHSKEFQPPNLRYASEILILHNVINEFNNIASNCNAKITQLNSGSLIKQFIFK